MNNWIEEVETNVSTLKKSKNQEMQLWGTVPTWKHKVMSLIPSKNKTNKQTNKKGKTNTAQIWVSFLQEAGNSMHKHVCIEWNTWKYKWKAELFVSWSLF